MVRTDDLRGEEEGKVMETENKVRSAEIEMNIGEYR